MAKILIALWLLLLAVAPTSAAVLHGSENSIWDTFNVGYDAPAPANVGYDAPEKSFSAYDVAPSRAQTDNERRIEGNSALFVPIGRLLAAKTVAPRNPNVYEAFLKLR